MILLDGSMDKFGEYGLILTYILIGLALLGMFLGIFISVMQNLKKGGMVAIIGLVGLLVLFGIGYSMSSNEVPESLQSFVGASGYQMSSGGLITTYVLMFVAFVLMVLGLVKGIISGN